MIDIISPLIKQFLPFAQKRMGFSEPPRLFLRGDNKNAKDPLGKTAYYDPNEKSITVYTTGRHPKDVMRSISHELVHHAQCCRGDFEGQHDTGPGYAQNDSHMREMEREAYEVGNMCFRDWEDSLKNTIYLEHLQKGDKKMSTKDWKNKELTTLLSEAWGFKFNNLEEFNEFNGEGELQAENEEEITEEAVEETSEETVEESATSEEELEERARGRRHQKAHDPARDDNRTRPMEEADDAELEEGEGNKKTPKHDDNPKLKGGQEDLPDTLQQAIIGSSDDDKHDDKKKKKVDEARMREIIAYALKSNKG